MILLSSGCLWCRSTLWDGQSIPLVTWQAVLVSDWPSSVCGNAISLNGDTPTFSIREAEDSPHPSFHQGRLKDEKWPDACVSSPSSPFEGRDVSIKTVSLWLAVSQTEMHWCQCVPFSPEASIDQRITRRFCPTGVITALSWDLLSGEGDRSVLGRWTGLQAAGCRFTSLGGKGLAWRIMDAQGLRWQP